MSNKIAPHEGKEIELVLAGKKPFAVIEAAKDPKQFRLAFRHADRLEVRATAIDEISIELRGTGCRHHYKYMQLMTDKKRILKGAGGKQVFQRRMGEVFGYTSAEIEEFLEKQPCTDPNCNKCGNQL